MNYRKYKTNRGAAMMILVFFFVFITLSILIGIVTPVVREYKIAGSNLNSRKAYFLAESGVEDALYRLRNSKQLSTSETLVLGTESATTTITTVGNNEKQIDSLGDATSNQRKISMTLTTGQGIAFNYGLQAGNGGMTIDGGSTIDGNVYSNGSVNAVSATVTGSAVAADSVSLTADQINDTPIPPSSSITFRNVAASQDFAQSFEVSSTTPVSKVSFYIKKVGTPADAIIRIVADNNGSPSTTTLPIGTVTLASSQVTTSYGWIEALIQTPVSLVPNTTYWVVIDNGSQNSNSYYVVGANTLYTSGTAKTGAYNGSWTVTNLDGYFKVYTGGTTAVVGGATYSSGFMVGANGVGDAWARTVKGTSAQGKVYCITGLNNNKSCDTSRGVPSPEPLPFSDANIDSWKDEAEAGGTISGNYTVGSSGASLGPKKITGNLTVNGGGTLTLTGTIWVEGTVTITAGGKLKLPASYGKNSGTLISDSRVTISGGGSIGSGTSGSYLFIVSTSNCPYDVSCSGNNAVSVTGGAGAIAVNAQNGTIGLSGGASLNAVVGNAITVTGGSTVTYDQGLASPSFTSGPSGTWTVSSWKEAQ